MVPVYCGASHTLPEHRCAQIALGLEKTNFRFLYKLHEVWVRPAALLLWHSLGDWSLG